MSSQNTFSNPPICGFYYYITSGRFQKQKDYILCLAILNQYQKKMYQVILCLENLLVEVYLDIKGENMRVFTEIDEEFICENCGKKVEKLGYSCRNHCNHCLYSKP